MIDLYPLDEDAVATLNGEDGPGITAWCSGLRKACACGHAKERHGFQAGGVCNFLGCGCHQYRFVFAPAPGGESSATTRGEDR